MAFGSFAGGELFLEDDDGPFEIIEPKVTQRGRHEISGTCRCGRRRAPRTPSLSPKQWLARAPSASRAPWNRGTWACSRLGSRLPGRT
eukprot:2029114-Heterocapsa_arctica.AAC.1